jgi:hypothetical protein
MQKGDCDDDETRPFEMNPAKPRCNSINTAFNGPNMVWTIGGGTVERPTTDRPDPRAVR